MRKLSVAVALLVVLVMGCQPSEPAMTITASKAQDCLNDAEVVGQITPAGATPKVALQRKISGKWQDWKWYETGDSGEQAHVLTDSTLPGGQYAIRVQRDFWSAHLNGTLTFRVRSNGGTRFSNAVSITFPKAGC